MGYNEYLLNNFFVDVALGDFDDIHESDDIISSTLQISIGLCQVVTLTKSFFDINDLFTP